MKSLHILQGQFLQSQLSIRTLNSSKNLEFFIPVRILFHSSVPIEEDVLIPCLSVHDILWLHSD